MPNQFDPLLRENYGRRVLAIAVVGVLLLGIGCRPKGPLASDPTAVRDVVDENGRLLTLPQDVERVVSLAPNITEIVFAIGAQNKLVGVTSYCNYPEAARKITQVGDTIQPNIEAIVALRPQMVIVSTSSQLQAFVQKMREQRIAVYVTDPHDLEGIMRTITELGDLLGARANADRVVAQMRIRAADVANRVKDKPPVRVFFQLSREPLYTAGKNAFVTDLIQRAGGQSVTAQVPGAFPIFSAEDALASKPEAIVMTTMTADGKTNVADALLNSPAVLNKRVYEINGDLLTRPGPRVVDGIEAIARALHPDAF